jgi:Zn-dependent peptidase ImmA (M78 family)/transcriptional regulator with XRE-family HTH domain
MTPKTTSVPITGSVLRWAISESGMTESEVAQGVGISVNVLRSWASEADQPSRGQLESLAQLLKRPSAVFLLPEPPSARREYAQFRRAPGDRAGRLTKDEARWIREAERVQSIAALLVRGLERRPNIPVYSSEVVPGDVATKERYRIGIPDDIPKLASVGEAFRWWRDFLERSGVLVFQFSLGRSSCRGFSIWNEWAPVVAVNTTYNFPARIYTMFHEYGHLVTRTDSICVGFTSPRGRTTENGTLEKWCEKFSASFLLPQHSFAQYLDQALRISGRIGEVQIVSRIATHFRVSLRAVAMRLAELDRAEPDLYDRVDRVARVREQPELGGGGGQRRYQRRLEEFGRRLPWLLLEGAERQAIDELDVLDYLDITTSDLKELQRELAG